MKLGLAPLGILVFSLFACGGGGPDDVTTDDTQHQTAAATLRLTSDFRTEVEGTLKAGSSLRVEYALDRLPQCRGNFSGQPAWTITGFFSENGGAPKSFEVSRIDGEDRVAEPATVELSQGGDVALWFQVTNRWGCSEFDSDYGQNFHFAVEGAVPTSDAAIEFGKSGDPKVSGHLVAGGKVRVRYAQDRLTTCVRTQMGHPAWGVTGYAKIGGGDAAHFDTGRAEGSDRVSVDAFVDLPKSGTLELWFETTDIGGCHDYDSNGGKNYQFSVD